MTATRSAGRIEIERVVKVEASKESKQAWDKLCNIYFRSTQLEFRKNTDILINKKERYKSINLIEELYNASTYTFIHSLGIDSSRNMQNLLHQLKGNVLYNIVEAKI
ncbi:MAG: hypothetical protein AAF619_05880 [Pseudomonadota bacterium]